MSFTVDGHRIDPSPGSLEADHMGCECSEGGSEDAYESDDSDALSIDVEKINEKGNSEFLSSDSILVCRIPDYMRVRIASLHQLEVLARTGLGNAVSQLDRLVQLYTEINEVSDV